jgi:hypothetical protein
MRFFFSFRPEQSCRNAITGRARSGIIASFQDETRRTTKVGRCPTGKGCDQLREHALFLAQTLRKLSALPCPRRAGGRISFVPNIPFVSFAQTHTPHDPHPGSQDVRGLAGVRVA